MAVRILAHTRRTTSCALSGLLSSLALMRIVLASVSQLPDPGQVAARPHLDRETISSASRDETHESRVIAAALGSEHDDRVIAHADLMVHLLELLEASDNKSLDPLIRRDLRKVILLHGRRAVHEHASAAHIVISDGGQDRVRGGKSRAAELHPLDPADDEHG